MTMLMNVERYFMTAIISVKFAQIQLVRTTVVVLPDSLVNPALTLTSVIVICTIVTKKRAYVTIRSVLSLVNVMRDTLGMEKLVLILTNVETEISTTVTKTQHVSIL